MMGECMNMFRTGWAQNVPVSYKFKSKERGNVEHIEYETIDYTNNRKIIKQAEIYLPFGYDENEKYNVFYLNKRLSYKNKMIVMVYFLIEYC